MIGILIYFAVSFGIGFLANYIYQEFYVDDDTVASGLTTLMLGVVIWLILYVVAPVTYDAEGREPISVTNITALKDNQVTASSYFLGTGSTDGSQYYFYMTESEKGKRMGKISASKRVFINEGSTTNPRLEKYEAEYTNEFLTFILPDYTFADYEYVFHIPEETVTTEFNVDME